MLRWQFGPPSSWGYNILPRLVSRMRRQCVTPENINTSTTEGSFSKTSPHPSGNSNKTSHNFLNFWVLKNPPPPQEIPIPSVRGVWIFYGIVLQNWTLYSDQLVLKRFLSEPLEPPFSEPWKQTKIANNAVNDPMSKVGMAKKRNL